LRTDDSSGDLVPSAIAVLPLLTASHLSRSAGQYVAPGDVRHRMAAAARSQASGGTP